MNSKEITQDTSTIFSESRVRKKIEEIKHVKLKKYRRIAKSYQPTKRYECVEFVKSLNVKELNHKLTSFVIG